jgi:endonuclease YncB( thermonuclease family)
MKLPGTRLFGLRRRTALNIALLLVGLSLYQYFTEGQVSWHRTALSRFTTQENAAWRLAADKAEELGERKESASPSDFDITGRVVGVLDGDSILVLDRAEIQHTVRLFGIDAPEKGQPYADKARSHLRELLSGKTVGIVRQDEDQYGRVVGSVYAGKQLVNLSLVREGYAWWYRRFAPHDHQLQKAEEEARNKGVGLWALPNPVAPWDWRRSQFRSAAAEPSRESRSHHG